MQILPSLLEYTVESLREKLEILKNNPHFELTRQESLHLHLDFVLTYFARERSVRESLGFESVHNLLTTRFADQSLTLTIHFMGELDDLPGLLDTLRAYPLNPLWNYVFFVPANYRTAFAGLEREHVVVGVWYDLAEWQPPQDPDTPHLLMTVRAGLSGQKLEKPVEELAIEFTRHHENYFVLDGGWSLETDPSRFNDNVDVVSHSSFWGQVLPEK